MPDEKSNEGERKFAFSSNLKLKLSNFLTVGQVKTSMAFDAQRAPIWGETWTEFTWAEIQPHFAIVQASAVLQAREGAPSPPPPVVEIEQLSMPRLEEFPKK